jgi:hypothetical protein
VTLTQNEWTSFAQNGFWRKIQCDPYRTAHAIQVEFVLALPIGSLGFSDSLQKIGLNKFQTPVVLRAAPTLLAVRIASTVFS